LEKCKVTLYVKSVKTPVGSEEAGRFVYLASPGLRGGMRILRRYDKTSRTKYDFILPSDQREVADMVEAAVQRYGFEVEVVDVTREELTHKIRNIKLRIRSFPTLITSHGERIEGDIKKEQVELILRKMLPRRSWLTDVEP
jgi:hypothetical protein